MTFVVCRLYHLLTLMWWLEMSRLFGTWLCHWLIFCHLNC